MNFKIIQIGNGEPEMAWETSEDISTNIYWSLWIRKGDLYNAPDFGIDMTGLDKMTTNVVKIFKIRIEKALSWLVDIGKAVSISVLVERDLTNINKINYRVDAVQSDGIPITVNNFVSVGGV
jgi:phage gp46-like protein